MRHVTSLISASVFASLMMSAAWADEAAAATERFNIRSQPLSQALRAYSEQTGEQVVFFSKIGRGRDSFAVAGQLTRDQALEQMLQNTGLRFERINTRTVAISAAATSNTAKSTPPPKLEWASDTSSVADAPFIRLAQAETAPGPQAPSEAAATAPEDDPFSMQEVVITGTASRDRTKYDSSVAISTFNAKDIAQQAPKSTADLISSVPGFWVESTAGTTQGNVFARGIIQDGGYRYVALMEDGIPLYPVSELSFYNPDQFVRVDETIDRVEALRGGTAPIFTTGAVGGAINFVTRKPRPDAQGDLKVSAGNYGMYSADGYWGTTLPNEWGVLVGGYYRKSDGIRDPGYTADKGGQLRLAVTRKFGSATLEFFGKYIDDRSLFVVPIPLEGSPSDPRVAGGGDAGTYALQSQDLRAAGLPQSANEVGLQGSDLADGIHPTLGTLGSRFTWAVNDTSTLTNLLRYTNGDVRFDGIFPGDAPVTGVEFAADRGVAPAYTVINSGAVYTPTQLVQNHGHWVVGKHYNALQDDLRFNFTHGAHDLTAGVYFADYSMDDRWSLGNLLLMDVTDQPKRLFLPGVTDARGFTQYSFFNLIADYDAKAYAAFASDEWQVTDTLRLDFGVRYDKQKTDASISNATNVDLDGNPATTYDVASQVGANPFTVKSVDFHNTGYSAGFNYELVPKQHALFGHYTKSAKLPHFDDIRGGSAKKDGVKNLEFGYKTSLRHVALFATLFQTEFDNVFFNDILANGSQVGRSAQTRTRGVELEGVLNPIDTLAVRFSITQQDPKYRDFTGAVVDNTGNVIRRIPKTMVRLTPTFTFAGDRARLFATYTHVGKRFGNDENTIDLPSYDKLDAGVSFDVNSSLTVQIVGDNLTDEVGLTESNPRTDVGAGGIGETFMARPLFGRSVLASATVRF